MGKEGIVSGSPSGTQLERVDLRCMIGCCAMSYIIMVVWSTVAQTERVFSVVTILNRRVSTRFYQSLINYYIYEF